MPYNRYSIYLKKKYNERVQKITVLGGFTCPNRDGSLGTGGCTYCNNNAFAPPDFLKEMSITEQINHGIRISKKRYKSNKHIIYFQSYSNTYAPIEKLKKLFEEAISHPLVCGLSIGTRPDCIDVEKIEYLEHLAKDYDITIEYGLESIFDQTLKRINRGHNYQSFINAVQMTKNRGIKICAHMILGFPWESMDDYKKTAETIGKIPIDFLKIHQLHIIKNTNLGDQYIKNPFPMLLLDEYIDIIIMFLERINPQITIQRLMGETPKHLLLSPDWNISISKFIQKLSDKMKKQETFQGKFYHL